MQLKLLCYRSWIDWPRDIWTKAQYSIEKQYENTIPAPCWLFLRGERKKALCVFQSKSDVVHNRTAALFILWIFRYLRLIFSIFCYFRLTLCIETVNSSKEKRIEMQIFSFRTTGRNLSLLIEMISWFLKNSQRKQQQQKNTIWFNNLFIVDSYASMYRSTLLKTWLGFISL